MNKEGNIARDVLLMTAIICHMRECIIIIIIMLCLCPFHQTDRVDRPCDGQQAAAFHKMLILFLRA